MLATVFVTLVVISSPMLWQPHPDFSGKWALSLSDEPKPSEPPPAVPTGSEKVRIRPPHLTGTLGTDFAIRQSDQSLEIVRRVGGSIETVTYKLDGSESRNSEGPVQTSSTAKWDGDHLVITTRLAIVDANSVDVLTRVFWLNPDGALVIETTGVPGLGRSLYNRQRN